MYGWSRGSNPLPWRYKRHALPTELQTGDSSSAGGKEGSGCAEQARRTEGLVRGAGTGATGSRTRTGSLVRGAATGGLVCGGRSEEHTSELQSL